MNPNPIPCLAFAFGEGGSYLYSGPKASVRSNLPQEVEDLLQDPYAVTAIYNVAFGCGGAFYIGFCYDGPDGQRVDDYRCRNLPEQLQRWLGLRVDWEQYIPGANRTVKRSRCGRDIATTRVWFGSGGSWVAEDKDTWNSQNVPLELMRGLNLKLGAVRGRTYCLTLGYNSAYFWVDNRNRFRTYDLSGSSQALDKFVDKLSSSDKEKLEYITVSPFAPNRYIVFFADGTYYASLPESWRAQCDVVSASTVAFLKKEYPKLKPIKRPDKLTSILQAGASTNSANASNGLGYHQGSASMLTTSHNHGGGIQPATSSFHTNTAPDAMYVAHTTEHAHSATMAQTLGIFHIGNFGSDMSNLNTVSFAMTGDSYGHHAYGGGGDGDGGGGGGV